MTETTAHKPRGVLTQSEEERPVSTGSAGKVLVAEDSEIVREIVRSTLEEAGFEVVTLNSGLGLTTAVRRELPDLLLLDVNMAPLDGDAAIAILRKHLPTLKAPLLFYSDLPEETLIERTSSSGADGFVRKTENHQDLVRTVRAWMKISVARSSGKTSEGSGS